MSDTHEPTENYRRFTRGPEVLEIDLDYITVLRREGADGAWDEEECNWDGEAEERFEELVADALAQGWEEDASARTSLADALAAEFGALPAAYKAFLDAGQHETADGTLVQGMPTFTADSRVIVQLDNLRIVHLDFCGLNPDDRYLPISTELVNANNPHGDPHALFFAIDRQSADAAVVMVSPGGITPAWPTFAAFVAATRPA